MGSVRCASSWRAFYSCVDETIGFEWQLWCRDLGKKAEWEHWKILEPHARRLIASEWKLRGSDAARSMANAAEP